MTASAEAGNASLARPPTAAATALKLTPEQAERGYNNRAAVPDHPQYFARWAASSAHARASLPCALDVRYGARPKETLDLFQAGGKRGLLFFIHGGYWRALDKSDHSFVAAPFVAEGFDVAVINYDLCPQVDVATIVEECRNALRWIVAHGHEHGVATERIVVSGHSAGGHLTAMLHATDWRALDVDPAIIAGGASISGLFDLEPLLLTSINADLRLDAAAARAASPAQLQPTLERTLLLIAGADETSEFVRQSELLWDLWPGVRPAGSTGPLLIPGANHFSALDRFADASHPAFRETVQLFG